MKRIAIAVVVFVGLIAGVACGGSSGGSDARSQFESYKDTYGPVIDELMEAFGTDEKVSEMTWEEFIAEPECDEPIAGEDVAFITMFIGADLAERNLSVADFVRDTNALNAAVRAEGYCG